MYSLAHLKRLAEPCLPYRPSPTSYYNALHWGQMFNERVPKFMAFNCESTEGRLIVACILFVKGKGFCPQELQSSWNFVSLRRAASMVER